MAYDKAVDSAALDAGLTAIANAIREKAGSSDALAFPDAMAAAIAAIEAGYPVAYGTVTPESNVNKLTITHGLNQIPHIAMFWINDQIVKNIATSEVYFGLSTVNNDVFSGAMSYSIVQNGTSTDTARYITSPLTLTSSTPTSNLLKSYGAPTEATSSTFNVGDPGSNYFLKGGKTYHWIAIGGMG